MNGKKKILGILGGLGPLASVYFYELITKHTKASCDQDHIDVMLLSGASTPDRTDFITGKSTVSPLESMKKGVRTLENAGAELIVIPCNTAHYFYNEIEKSSVVPVLNIVRETVLHAKARGAEKLGILATDGTIISGSYKNECDKSGILYEIPDTEDQKILMKLIYDCIKKSEKPDPSSLENIIERLLLRGCDYVIIGCTELSLIPINEKYKNNVIDSLSVLAKKAIVLCGAVPCGFTKIYDT